MIFLFRYQKRQKKFIEQKNAFAQTLLQSQLEIQEQTLKNISQEIHDNIGQVLSLVKLNLFKTDVEEGDQLRRRILDSRNLVSKAIVDLRDLSHSLNTDYVEENGLIPALAYELEMIAKTGILKTAMQVNGNSRAFDKQKELIIFRIAQEAFQNVIKHAQASELVVVADFQESGFLLSIRDDGCGVNKLEPNSTNGKPGMGIRNMQKRAEMIKGYVSISSDSSNAGTTVLFRL
ncbi:sensor histidine kinase [Pollutibacter soli]|uniref:sensor histidine kinase n=1 Tax=Pollutibacter soli TaxID=3034157 RepID=UPI003013500E